MTTRRTLNRVRKLVKGDHETDHDATAIKFICIRTDDLLDLLFDAEEVRGLRERVEEQAQALTVIAEAMGIGGNHG